MKILLYTQESSAGGSLRLLLNLAEHLTPRHNVAIAFDATQRGGKFLEDYPTVKAISYQDAASFADTSDTLLAHLPYGRDPILVSNAKRKLVLSVEVMSKHPQRLENEDVSRIDALLYLHPEQVSGFDDNIKKQKCHQMPLINNIKTSIGFSKSGNIGCIGDKSRVSIEQIVDVLQGVSCRRKMHIWCSKKIFKSSVVKRYTIHYLKWLFFVKTGKVCTHPINPDIKDMLEQFDLLLHMPLYGNGTSTVVSDALHAGKLVLLSPLPAYREAYGHLPGVYFWGDPGVHVERLLSEYDEKTQQHIQSRYLANYNRRDILKKWQDVIEGVLA